MPKKSNPFESYVEQRLHAMAQSAEFDSREAAKQTVTVRLNPPLVRLADGLAVRLDETRQELLLDVIATGLHEIASTFAEAHGEKSAEIYKELMALKDYQEGDFK